MGPTSGLDFRVYTLDKFPPEKFLLDQKKKRNCQLRYIGSEYIRWEGI